MTTPSQEEHERSLLALSQEFQRHDTGQRFKTLINYRHLDQLRDIVASRSSRLLKADVLDLPPKLYQKRFFEMTPEQRRLYDTLRKEFMILIEDDMVTAPLAIVRMTRLQQITAGFLPTDEDELITVDPNPRIACLRDVVQDLQGQFIVWAKFTRDVDAILALLEDMDITACRFDGEVDHDSRGEARLGFREGRYRAFVAKPSCAGEGLTLTESKTAIYYTQSYSLGDRLQSEDRQHRIGTDSAVNYIDIIAQNTIDGKIVEALRQQLGYASLIQGDAAKEWI